MGEVFVFFNLLPNYYYLCRIQGRSQKKHSYARVIRANSYLSCEYNTLELIYLQKNMILLLTKEDYYK